MKKHSRKKVKVIETFKKDGKVYHVGDIFYIKPGCYADFWYAITDEKFQFTALVPQYHFAIVA